MKKIAVLSDIHGNMPALEAALSDLGSQGVDEVLVGGDLVGRGPEGRKVVRRIAELGWPCVRGNHEDYLLAFRREEVPEGWLRASEWSASRWMAAELGPDDERFIGELPFSIRSRAAPELRLVHGSPRSYNEGLGPWNTDEELAGHLHSVDEEVLVCAHTHRPLHRKLNDGHVVNVGAVGLPFNRDPRAQYAILHQTAEGWQVEFRRVAYERQQIRDVYRTSGFLEEGGVTARLLELELSHAAPFLVPFMRWVDAGDLPPEIGSIRPFLDFYDPDESMRTFLRRLEQLRTKRGPKRGQIYFRRGRK